VGEDIESVSYSREEASKRDPHENIPLFIQEGLGGTGDREGGKTAKAGKQRGERPIVASFMIISEGESRYSGSDCLSPAYQGLDLIESWRKKEYSARGSGSIE